MILKMRNKASTKCSRKPIISIKKVWCLWKALTFNIQLKRKMNINVQCFSSILRQMINIIYISTDVFYFLFSVLMIHYWCWKQKLGWKAPSYYVIILIDVSNIRCKYNINKLWCKDLNIGKPCGATGVQMGNYRKPEKRKAKRFI